MNTIIVCDFDGTITKKDSLYNFFENYASKKWLEVEKLWKEGKISSKKCLTDEFELVQNLSADLIKNYIKMIEIDENFKDFLNYIKKKNIDFVIVSDGVDYFIDKILKNNDIKNLKIITNHARFKKGNFKITFLNTSDNCKNKAGCCKCEAVKNLRKIYDRIIYIGDGFSDFCASKKADLIFAKNDLAKYLEKEKIQHIKYNNFKEVKEKCFV